VNDKLHVEVISKAPKAGLIHGKVEQNSCPPFNLLIYCIRMVDIYARHYDITSCIFFVISASL
jgi:hypothetical protein